MSCHRIAAAQVCTVKSTCSQSDHSRISVELDSHADTCVAGSNVLAVNSHGRFVDIHSFHKAPRHTNASAIDTAIAYKDTVMHSTVILLINQAIKIDNMSNILI